MAANAFEIHRDGDSPFAAAAVHNGHDLREEVARAQRLPEADRLREEDPFTGQWASIAGNRLIALRSRFEVDLNRPRETAVYRTPDDAWGLDIWNTAPDDEVVARSLSIYDAFYAQAHELMSDLEQRFGRFVVFDLHSYNHRRDGPDGPPADPRSNPEVNLGTGSLDHERWGPVVDAFVEALRGFDFGGRSLDVRENVKFQGGRFPRWVHERFPDTGCALAVEFKKTFMDEWTGEPDPAQLDLIRAALQETVAPVLEALLRL